MAKRIFCALTLAALAFAPGVQAENHALLIGVSDYPALDKESQLFGPRNDVVLMRSVLQANGFAAANIRVLSDGGVDTVGLPTREAILHELKLLGERAGAGDFTYLQFSGHGSQQPTRAGKAYAEPDGLDEIFLPRDIDKWDGDEEVVRNAIADEEIGRAIARIREKGSFVWAVFDTCHSGNITRGSAAPGDGYRTRKVAPLSLGIPQSAIDRAVSAATSTKTRGGQSAPVKKGALGDPGKGKGGYVFFYAAQSYERAPELRLPEVGSERKEFGLFTFALSQLLATDPGITYRQAGERILQIYAGRSMRDPTPLFEGSGLDAPVFGQKPGETLRQWRLQQIEGIPQIDAGAIHQFSEGAIFAIYPNTAAQKESVLGYLRASRVGVATTQLATIAFNGKPLITVEKLPADAVVRLEVPVIRLGIKVARPAGKVSTALNEVINSLQGDKADQLQVEIVPAEAAEADLRLALADQKLWLLPADGTWVKSGSTKSPNLSLEHPQAELRQLIASTLHKVAKVTNIHRLAALTMGGKIGRRLDIRYQVTSALTGKSEEVETAAVPELKKNDQIRISITNRNTTPVDVTVLGIDSLYAIEALFPMANESNRINPGDTLTIPALNEEPIVISGDTSGQESIMVIATEAAAQAAPSNLAFLAQEGIVRERGGAGQNTLEDLFAEVVGEKIKTRGDQRGASVEKTSIQVFSYRAVMD